MRRYKLLAVLLTPFTLSTLRAQVASEFRGRVTDHSGAAVPAAKVRLTEMRSGVHYDAVTGGEGYYDFPSLPPGTYQVEASANAFNPYRREGVSLNVGQTVSVDLPLPVGWARETVVVTSDLPVLQAQTSDVQTTIPQTHIEAIPLNSRNFINLTQLAPGVELPPGTLLPRINGGRPRTNEYLFDGISALQPEPGQVAFFPLLDSIDEFTVETNNVSAEFGRFNGGVVNVSTRYGTDQLHGSLFEYLRNESLNARNFFAPVGQRKPEYRRNLYGGTIGFPILTDRLFFFGDYQGIRQLIGTTRISTVPTVAERGGNFSGVSAIYDPSRTNYTGGRYIRPQFTGNQIPQSQFDSVALALLQRIPVPTAAGAANNYSRTGNDSDHQNQFDTRFDAAYGSRDHAFLRYTYYNEVELPVTPFPEGSGVLPATTVLGTGNVQGHTNVLGQQVVFNETHTFTPRLSNDARVGYTRRANYQDGVTAGNTASAALGVPGIPTNAAFSNALPLFTFTGFQQLGSSASTFSRYQTGVYELVDTLSWSRGAHSIKLGADVRWYQLNAISPPNPTGSFAFTTTGTNTQTAASATSTGGNAFASFLLGQVDTFSIDLQTSVLRPRDHVQEYFVQDDWRISPRLTANLGVRWTFNNPSTEKNNQGAVFNLATQQLDYAGVNGNPRSARNTHYGNLGPRLGFAYQLDSKAVIRSGFGMVFFDQSGITTPFTVPQFPFIQNVRQATQDSINPAFTLAGGPTVQPIALTANAGLGQSVYTVNRNAGSGYVEQYNLALQRSLTNSLSFQVSYVGQHVVHVGIPDFNLNQLTAAQLASGLTNPTALTGKVTNPYYGQLPAGSALNTPTIAAAQLLKTYPRFQNVAVYRNDTGTANYNAIEAQVEKRLARGMSFTFAYTHSRLIDDASSVFSSTVLSSPNTSSLIAADTFRPYLERDVSTGDMPNVFAGSLVYELPAGRNHRFGNSAPGNTLLGGWAVNSIVTAQSGMPVAVTQATNNNAFAGFALQRPNLIGEPNLAPELRYPGQFFNIAAFATAPQFTLGNASRNPVRGPAFRDWDFSLVKRTDLGELTRLEFRAELFNLTNTPACAQPNGSFGAAAFGTITATTAEQRVAQFALRLMR